jgi:acetyl esterase/lipase
VIALEYRLAPEFPFPAQMEDALAAFRALRAQGFAASAIGLAGESAGAGLCMSLLLSLRAAKEPMPAAAVLISPWVDLEARGRSFDENARYDFVQRKAMEAYARRFVPVSKLRDPLASPVHASLEGLPPVLVQVGEVETLRDDGVLLAERIEAAGGQVDLEVYPDMVHAFHVFAPFLPEARRAIARAAAFIETRLRP